jgi:hypothetical protein
MLTLQETAASLELPKRIRRNAQRLLRWRERELCLAFPQVNAIYAYPYPGAGAERYLRAVLPMKRRTRRAPPHRPWERLLRDWSPEKRCAGSFAENAQGQPVHHDDPSAVRWCLGGWLAHLCQRPSQNRPHRVAVDSWVDRIDDREARRLLDEIWALIPARARAVTERIWRERTTGPARKRLDQHPLGYWWFLAPHLAARHLGIQVSQNGDQNTGGS